MSLATNDYSNSANSYYTGDVYWKCRNMRTDGEEFDEEVAEGDRAYKILREFIRKGDLIGLINSEELKKYDINYRYGEEKNTLLHVAYRWNKPQIVEYLIKNGADERIPNEIWRVPMEVACDNYSDSLPRVVNIVVQKYFASLEPPSPDNPHILFDVLQNFIHEKNWKYFDNEGSRKQIPFRDGRLLSSLGLPEFVYHVNCYDLANLFIKAAQKIGMDAELVLYTNFRCIHLQGKEKNGIIGKFAMFDGSNNSDSDSRNRYDTHSVAYSEGWHFDLTFQIKYQDRNAVLRSS